MLKRLKVYFIHSVKIDYQTLLYRPILSSPVCLAHELILPLSPNYKERYVKELHEEADVIVAEVSDPNFALKLELKWAVATNKPIKYISLSNNIPSKYKKLVPNIEQFTNDRSIVKIIEDFISEQANVVKQADTTVILGDIDEVIPPNA